MLLKLVKTTVITGALRGGVFPGQCLLSPVSHLYFQDEITGIITNDLSKWKAGGTGAQWVPMTAKQSPTPSLVFALSFLRVFSAPYLGSPSVGTGRAPSPEAGQS